MKRRLPPTKVSGGLLNFRSFKKPSLFLYTFSAFLSFLGIYTSMCLICLAFYTLIHCFLSCSALTFIDSSAIEIGLSEDFSFYLVAIANAASVLGRGGSGLIADRIGSDQLFSLFVFGIENRLYRIFDNYHSIHLIHRSAHFYLACYTLAGWACRNCYFIRVSRLLYGSYSSS